MERLEGYMRGGGGVSQSNYGRERRYTHVQIHSRVATRPRDYRVTTS